jgi:hypothetical protein
VRLVRWLGAVSVVSVLIVRALRRASAFFGLLGSAQCTILNLFGAWSMCTCTDVQRFESLAEDGII